MYDVCADGYTHAYVCTCMYAGSLISQMIIAPFEWILDDGKAKFRFANIYYRKIHDARSTKECARRSVIFGNVEEGRTLLF